MNRKLSAALKIAAGAQFGNVSRTDLVNALATLADEVLATKDAALFGRLIALTIEHACSLDSFARVKGLAGSGEALTLDDIPGLASRVAQGAREAQAR